MAGDGGAHRRGERLLEPGSEGQEDIAHQVVLGREVVHDDPVADAEPLGDPAVGELAQPVGEGGGDGALEDLLARVLVTHTA